MKIITTNRKSICTVKLEYNDKRHHMFYCNDCRNVVFQYKGEVIQILPGLLESSTPMLAMCSNDKCNKTYNIVWIVYGEI